MRGQNGTSPAAILLITDSLSRIIGLGSAGVIWSSCMVVLSVKWRKLRDRCAYERWSKREKFVLGLNQSEGVKDK